MEQLACDRAALENLAQAGRLQRRGPAGESYAVGQGVALVLLKPLSAARRDSDQILGVVDALGVGFDASSLKASIGAAASQVPLRQVPTTFRSSNTQPSLELTGGVGLADLVGQVSEATGLT